MQERTREVEQAVKAAMMPFLGDEFGNPSSQHEVGRRANSAMSAARQSLADLLNAQPSEIFFAPNSDYANNVAILGRARFVEANDLPRQFYLFPPDMLSIAAAAGELRERGWQVHFTDSVEQLAAQKGKACTHMDASSLPGFRWGRVGDSLAFDTMTLSASALGAPLQLAVLVVQRGVNLMPIVFGGGQEWGFFPGTEPVAQIVGLGAAAQYWSHYRASEPAS